MVVIKKVKLQQLIRPVSIHRLFEFPIEANAIQFTESGRVTVKARQGDGYLALSVSDTDKGISAA
ncbi:MAG: hypothetical protein O7G87_18620 [bacterium]|nr:hypothetical protein [bacterium]